MAPSITSVSDPSHIRILSPSITLQQSLSSRASFLRHLFLSLSFSLQHFAREKKGGGVVYARHPPIFSRDV